MSRDSEVYLQDILTAIERIRLYVAGLSRQDFGKDILRQDGVARNLEIIGEAVKNLPLELRQRHQQLEWRKIAGVRDVLAHAYFDVDLDIVWDIVTNKLDALEEQVRRILTNP